MSEHFQIFNVSTTIVQGLKNVSLKVWEEFITQSRYSIKDAHPLAQHSPFYTLCNPAKTCAFIQKDHKTSKKHKFQVYSGRLGPLYIIKFGIPCYTQEVQLLIFMIESNFVIFETSKDLRYRGLNIYK
jgi:hypothetical protein